MPTLNTLNVKGPLKAGVDQLLERYVVTGSAITSKTFSNLKGNTDLEYYVRARIVNANGAGPAFTVYFNADTTAANYGFQRLLGSNSSPSAYRATSNVGIPLCSANGIGDIAQGEMTIFAKSGTIRTTLGSSASAISGTTVSYSFQFGGVWNNSVDEITSLTVLSDQTTGIGVGSILELWCRRGARN